MNLAHPASSTDRESRLRRSLKRLGFDLVEADAGQFYIRHQGSQVHATSDLFGLSLDGVETWIRDRRTGYDQQRQGGEKAVSDEPGGPDTTGEEQAK